MNEGKWLLTVQLSWLHTLTRGHSNNGEKKAGRLARVDESTCHLYAKNKERRLMTSANKFVSLCIRSGSNR